MKPYFYVIQNEQNKKYYAGIRYSKTCDPSDLLVSYFTSCEEVIDLIKGKGIPFTIRKILQFENIKDAHQYESKFLKRVKAAVNPKFYNKNYGNTPIQKYKKWFNNGKKSTLRYVCPDGWIEGRILNTTNLGKHGNQKANKTSFKKGHISKHLVKGFRKGISKPQKICPHCGQIGGGGAMIQWHFNNCRSKNGNTR